MNTSLFPHLHCISKITKGRYRDAPSIIIHNSAPGFSSLDAVERRDPSLSFLLALVRNSPIIHPAFKEGTVLQGLNGRRQSTSKIRPGAARHGTELLVGYAEERTGRTGRERSSLRRG